MSTVIYLYNQEVQIVTGTPGKKSTSIQSAIKVMAPEGSIINGIVTDVESFTEFLKTAKVTYNIPSSGVTLVLGSSKFVGKTLDMPLMKDSETTAYIRREYVDMGRGENSLIGYIRMNGSARNMSKVYAEEIDPDFIGDYCKIFENAGIKLGAIYSAESSLINYVSQKMSQEYPTFVMLVADAKTLITVLWIKGTFYYYNSVRSFHEKGTIEYAEDIGRSISKLLQFISTRQVDEKLKNVVIAGIEPDRIQMYQQAIRDVDSTLVVSPYKLAYDMQPYLMAISGLYSNGARENYYTVYQQYVKATAKKEKGDGFSKNLIVPGAILIVMLGIVVALMFVKYSKTRQLKSLEADLEAAQFDLIDYERYVVQNSKMQEQVDGTNDISENILTYPCGNTAVLDVIMKCADGYAQISYNQFSARGGSVTMTATATDVEMINQFIKRLMAEEIFTAVDYTGYTYHEASDSWNINVTCILSESAGRRIRRDN